MLGARAFAAQVDAAHFAMVEAAWMRAWFILIDLGKTVHVLQVFTGGYVLVTWFHAAQMRVAHSAVILTAPKFTVGMDDLDGGRRTVPAVVREAVVS